VWSLILISHVIENLLRLCVFIFLSNCLTFDVKFERWGLPKLYQKIRSYQKRGKNEEIAPNPFRQSNHGVNWRKERWKSPHAEDDDHRPSSKTVTSNFIKIDKGTHEYPPSEESKPQICQPTEHTRNRIKRKSQKRKAPESEGRGQDRHIYGAHDLT